MKQAGQRDRVWHLVVSYWLLVPLVIFTAQYGFSFLTQQQNTEIGLLTLSSIQVSQSDLASYTYMTYVSAFFALAFVVSVRKQLIAVLSSSKLLLLPSLWAIASTLWSDSPALSFRKGMLLLITTLFALALVTRFRPEQLIQLVLLLGFVDSIASLFLIIGMPRIGIMHQDALGAWQGLFGHKNVYGIAMVYFLAAGLYRNASSFVSKAMNSVLCVLFVVQIYGCQARTAWALAGELVLVCFLLYFANVVRARDRILLLPTTIIVGVLLIEAAASYIPVVLTSMGRDESLTGRTDIWAAILVFIFRKPVLGYGFNAFFTGLSGNAAELDAMISWQAPHAHNGFLEVWLELGAVGLMILLLLLIHAGRDAVVCFRTKIPNYVGWYIAMLSIQVVSNFDETSFMVPLSFSWTLFVLCCAGLRQEALQRRREYPSRDLLIDSRSIGNSLGVISVF